MCERLFRDTRIRVSTERAWEEAEEIAAIADSLLLPTGTGDFIEKHKVDSGPGEELES